MIYLCSPVKTSAVHNFTCLYGPTENVQNEAIILTAQMKLFSYIHPKGSVLSYSGSHQSHVIIFKHV